MKSEHREAIRKMTGTRETGPVMSGVEISAKGVRLCHIMQMMDADLVDYSVRQCGYYVTKYGRATFENENGVNGAHVDPFESTSIDPPAN